jgi:hypothetical protein
MDVILRLYQDGLAALVPAHRPGKIPLLTLFELYDPCSAGGMKVLRV